MDRAVLSVGTTEALTSGYGELSGGSSSSLSLLRPFCVLWLALEDSVLSSAMGGARPNVVLESGPIIMSLVREDDRLRLRSRIRGLAVRPWSSCVDRIRVNLSSSSSELEEL
jgi:hypothetical protein